ncbi:hypothetical protein GGTG_05911 [Gaeumannomyces tritici R3-111a-1]|uniref:Uncharacterized protein n=1 Tax=Gaeumannomyces tritici (strain R3-111a-1) TaxID=644352 RepID=J3NXA4_GAET3|nr:hypothetical protein GGTG_05911 [Gaeumannomyces tritici R3-111a-1]EJT75986.1 hypothetical protein GGTG_05911 [Gaeumannomyces tritici R3-111a-1]
MYNIQIFVSGIYTPLDFLPQSKIFHCVPISEVRCRVIGSCKVGDKRELHRGLGAGISTEGVWIRAIGKKYTQPRFRSNGMLSTTGSQKSSLSGQDAWSALSFCNLCDGAYVGLVQTSQDQRPVALPRIE